MSRYLTDPMTGSRFFPTDPIVAMTVAARIVACDNILGDPSDDDVLLAVAEECDSRRWPTPDLATLHPNNRRRILAAFDNPNT